MESHTLDRMKSLQRIVFMILGKVAWRIIQKRFLRSVR